MLQLTIQLIDQKLVVLHPVEHGALTQLYAGTMPEALNYNGEVRFLFQYSSRAALQSLIV